MPTTLANNASTTIAGSSTGTGAGSKQVAATSLFPSSGQFYCLIESEIVIATVVDGTHLNFLVRGAEGTAAVTHATGVTITNIITAGAWAAILTDRMTDHYELVDHFIKPSGELGWTLVNTAGGGSIAHQDGALGHPGVERLHTGIGAANTVGLVLNNGSSPVEFRELWDFLVTVAVVTNDSNTAVKLGLTFYGTQANPANGVYIEKAAADTNWFFTRRASSSNTRTDSGIAVDTSYHRFRMRRIDASNIGFSVDGGTETVVSTGLPSSGIGSGDPTIHLLSASAVDCQLDVDRFGLNLTGLLS